MGLDEDKALDFHNLLEFGGGDLRHVQMLEHGGRKDEVEIPAPACCSGEVGRQLMDVANDVDGFARVEVEANVFGRREPAPAVCALYVACSDLQDTDTGLIESFRQKIFPARMRQMLGRSDSVRSEPKRQAGDNANQARTAVHQHLLHGTQLSLSIQRECINTIKASAVNYPNRLVSGANS